MLECLGISALWFGEWAFLALGLRAKGYIEVQQRDPFCRKYQLVSRESGSILGMRDGFCLLKHHICPLLADASVHDDLH